MLKPTAQLESHHGHHHGTVRSRTALLTRRTFLTASAAITGAGLAGAMSHAFGQQPRVRPTNEQVLGPFYPVTLPADQDADLTIIAGKDVRALGQVLYLGGRVMNLRGAPVVGAELEIWQANAAGRYTHPSERNPAPLDPNFEGYAKIRTGPDGGYSIKTIKPGAYPDSPTSMRPPHIHFDVRGRVNRLVTQMYFEGEILNAKDSILQSASRKEGLIASYGQLSEQQESNALVAVWNIVLITG